MEKKSLIIVADPNHMFAFWFAEYFLRNGYDVKVVSRYPYPNREIFNKEVDYISTKQFESKRLSVLLAIVARFIHLIEFIYSFFPNIKNSRVVSDAIIQCASIGSYLNKLESPPHFIYVQQVLTYGPVSYFYKKAPTVLKPWGGEIYNQASENKLIKNTIGLGLRNASLVNPSSVSAVNFLKKEYNLPHEKFIASLSFSGQEVIKKCMEENSRNEIRAKYNVKEGEILIFNIRRFQPKWGSKEVALAFEQLAKRNKNFKFILIAGSGDEANELLGKAEEHYKNEGIYNQFLIYYGHLPLESFSELTYSADIAVSVMHSGDMRSASIMNAITAECLPVLSKQDEYLIMQEQGFSCQFVDYNNIDEIVESCENYAFNDSLIKKTRQKNQVFLERYSGNDKYFEMLINKIDDCNIKK